jgi:hypothetical protein
MRERNRRQMDEIVKLGKNDKKKEGLRAEMLLLFVFVATRPHH